MVSLNPWAAVRAMEHVTVALIRLPQSDPRLGFTDGRSRIWINRRLDAIGRRCTLAHELVHIDHGHEGHQPPDIEAEVKREAARRMIDWTELVNAIVNNTSLADVAAELYVTPHMLADRLNALPAQKRAMLLAVPLDSPPIEPGCNCEGTSCRLTVNRQVQRQFERVS